MKKKLYTLLSIAAMFLLYITVFTPQANAAELTTIPVCDGVSLELSWPAVTIGSDREGRLEFNNGINQRAEYVTYDLYYYEIVPGTFLRFPDGYTWTTIDVYRQEPEFDFPYSNYLPTDYFYYRWFDEYVPCPQADAKEINFHAGWINSIACVTIGDLNQSYVDEYGETRYTTVGQICFKIRNPFIDVTPWDWYYKDAISVYNAGVMTGMDQINGIFGPYDMVSRAQFAVMLYRMEGSPAVQGTSPFPDVAPDTWYTDAAIWASENGIITGYSNGNFGPADLITREQMATMMCRYGTQKGYEPFLDESLEQFSDYTSISPFAADAMEWTVQCNLIRGKKGYLIAPHDTASRGECAAILGRFLTILADGHDLYI